MNRRLKTAPERRRGSALIIVLGGIAILTMLLLALAKLVQTEHRSTYAFGDSTEIRSLSEWPTNMVIAQLRTATDSMKGTRTWASQPGMIRTYGTSPAPDTGLAVEDSVYKLYSSKAMVEVEGFDPNGDVPPANWVDQAAHFVDLNEPVFVEREGNLIREFPIIDGNAAKAGHEGFSVEAIAGATDDHPIPMPVRWLYVLENGELALPEDGGGTMAKFSGPTAPTEDNPIIGRIAFWTDDESSKVNINTASEGKYWDMPRGNTHYDAFNYADKQPVKNEFQRYPGHPAMTSLSSVLEPYVGEDPETYFKLAPFIEGGGSESGTKNVDGNTPPITPDSDRLYATVDEFFFDAHGTGAGNNRVRNDPGINRQMLEETRFLLTAHSRSPEVTLLDRPRISIWPIQKDQGDRNAVDRLFAFCSETSQGTTRLPYYFQRLSVHDLDHIQNGYSSSQSTQDDFTKIERNRQLYDYLQFLTDQDVPGFGKNFDDKYPLDRDQILTEIIDYSRSGLNTMAMGLETDNEDSGYFYVPPRQVEGINAALGEGQVLPLKIGGTMGFGRNVTITEAALVFYATERDEEETVDFDYPGRDASKPSGFRAKQMKAFLMIEFFTPSTGLPSWSQNLSITIDGLEDMKVGERSLNFPPNAKLITHSLNGLQSSVNGAGHTCANMNLFQPFFFNEPASAGSGQLVLRHRNMDSQDPRTGYAWHSTANVPVSVTADTLEFKGGPIKITIRDPEDKEIVQILNMNFPETVIPVPYVWNHSSQFNSTPAGAPHQIEMSLQSRIQHKQSRYWSDFIVRPGDVVRSVEALSDLGTDSAPLPGGDFRLYSATPEIPETWFKAGGAPGQYDDVTRRFAMGLRSGSGWQYYGHLRSETSGEAGLDAIDQRAHNGVTDYHPYRRASSFRTAGALLEGTEGYSFNTGASKLYRDAHPVTARGQVAAYRRDGKPGDWDQGVGSNEDGPFINKPDETGSSRQYWDWGGNYHAGGYFQRGSFDVDVDGNNFSPNRQIGSPVMFGSLPTGVKSVRPWETLLFSPNPAGRETPADQAPTLSDHKGFSFPRDHLLLDLFWMPVVEPYAISEPFSTAGKVNLNYEIMPFRYIKRQTGIKAVLDSVQLMAIQENALARSPYGCIKGGRDQAHQRETRYSISTDPVDGTLRGFEDRFASGDIFRSASEICEIFLVPKPAGDAKIPYPNPAIKPTYVNMVKWWKQFRATGDNVREAPYNQILPRVTTQSNVFQVHYRVQLLKNPRGQAPDEWNEHLGALLGEYRGSTLLERYIDPNDPEIPDFASGSLDSSEKTLSQYYRFRIIRKKQFSP